MSHRARSHSPLARTILAGALAWLALGCSSSPHPYTITGSSALAAYVAESPERPTVIVDLDDTVVDGSTWKSIRLAADIGYRRTPPFPQSPRVLRRLARRWNVVFVTARPDFVAESTLLWLEHHGFPTAPVIFASSFLLTDRGKEDYKTAAIAAVRDAGLLVLAGVGDKATDMVAYERHDLRRYLLLESPDDPDLERTGDVDAIDLITESWLDAWFRIGAALDLVDASESAEETVKRTDRGPDPIPSL